MSRHTNKPVKLVYSHPIKGKKNYMTDENWMDHDKIFKSKVIHGGVLEKTIHSYRMWFLFLKLGLELENQEIDLVMKESKTLGNGTKTKRVIHKIKVNKKKYKDWDLDQILESTFDNWWKDHRYLFVDQVSQVLKTTDTISKDPDHITIQFDRRRRMSDVLNDLRMMNSIHNYFERQSRDKYSIKGRIRPITLLNRYNCLVLKLEDELSNKEIITHENNYIRPTDKRTKDGYSFDMEGIENYGRIVFDLISGTKKSFGGKQILLSVCDGYFLKHPTKTYL